MPDPQPLDLDRDIVTLLVHKPVDHLWQPGPQKRDLPGEKGDGEMVRGSVDRMRGSDREAARPPVTAVSVALHPVSQS